MLQDFREAVGAAVGDEGEPLLNEDRLREILNELPDIYTLHRRILNELENRIRHWWDCICCYKLLYEFNLLRKRLCSSLLSHIDALIKGRASEDCRRFPIQKSRILGFHHLYWPLRQECEPAGGQLPRFACTFSPRSPVRGQFAVIYMQKSCFPLCFTPAGDRTFKVGPV